MAVVDIRNLSGKTVGQLELADDVFAARVNPHLLHETVRHYLASQRAGTHKTKQKSEVSGSGRKLWKQKGTGRARIGSVRSPLWRHGGTVHGPVPRSYDYRLPRKVFLGALRSALSAKFADKKLFVVDKFELETHKTKAFREALSQVDGDSRTLLLVNGEENVNLARASRNLEGVKLVKTTAIQPYDLLQHESLVLSREAAEKLSRGLSENKTSGGPSTAVQIQGAASAEMGKGGEKRSAKPAAKASGKSAAKKPGKKPAAKSKAKPKAKKD